MTPLFEVMTKLAYISSKGYRVEIRQGTDPDGFNITITEMRTDSDQRQFGKTYTRRVIIDDNCGLVLYDIDQFIRSYCPE